MQKQNQLDKILAILQEHEERLSVLEGKKTKVSERKIDLGFKSGGTADKIIALIQQGFFDQPQSMSAMISEFKTKDYHFKSSDLTLPLRKLVHKGLLKRTKMVADGTQSPTWLFVKV